MKGLVLGASGQLGSCLKKVAAARQITDIVFPSETEGNILDEGLLSALMEREKPQFVINCAAYTAVDKAEDEQELCRKINKDGAANIARVCKTYQATMIQISTDFVFKGDIPKALSENDLTTPDNMYGLTKLEGEKEIIDILEQYYILRTSWLYSEYGNNFAKTMLRLGSEREELGVIVDQVGSPTYAIDLAGAILDIMQAPAPAYGLYHYSNEGAISWYDFAKAIFDIKKVDIRVKPVKSTEYITKATRPAFSVMDKNKIKSTFNMAIPYWRDSLEECLSRL
ncbi:dTDP-4-dehydrorhamnose reductase [Dyadobacter jejuensis]|uniref:dTDP-4-dehydrorhamnose reductase n=1 Tax=Dyadobacter jejuensis TaxID=1082580 RepID=A0A316ADX1_9BACT|nr:dTDP-4-dehydrorhamnose reductase [Dyadobacter jejuensis]PWJ55975.1 dTDP-4-dehydrorhamnose reductase [Dyadobacter jejuensis]